MANKENYTKEAYMDKLQGMVDDDQLENINGGRNMTVLEYGNWCFQAGYACGSGDKSACQKAEHYTSYIDALADGTPEEIFNGNAELGLEIF